MEEEKKINVPDETKETTTDMKEENKEVDVVEDNVSNPYNPNEMDSSIEEIKRPVTNKADNIDGEINLQNKVTELAYFKPISYIYDGFSNIDDEVDRVRNVYLKKIKKSKVIDMIAVGVMLIAFVSVLLVIFLNKKGSAALTYSVLGVALVLIIASFIVTSYFNKKDTGHIQEYLHDYVDTIDGYLIYGLNIENALMCPDAKVKETLFIEAHCYRTISSIDSRSVMIGKRKGYDIEIAEMAAVVPPVSLAKANEMPVDFINPDGTPFIPKELDDTMTGTTELQSKDMTVVDLKLSDEANNTDSSKRIKDEQKAQKNTAKATNRYGLFGRFCSYGFKVSSEESIIIYFMGDREFTMLPDYLTGFKAIKISGLRSKIVVFAADIFKSGKFFDEESVKMLNEIEPNQIFQSGFISLNSYGTKIGINLSDDLMNIPVKKRQVPGTVEAYKDVNDRIFRFIDHIEDTLKKDINENN